MTTDDDRPLARIVHNEVERWQFCCRAFLAQQRLHRPAFGDLPEGARRKAEPHLDQRIEGHVDSGAFVDGQAGYAFGDHLLDERRQLREMIAASEPGAPRWSRGSADRSSVTMAAFGSGSRLMPGVSLA
jgi:hypothetical protein